jgi:hypothetical protein
MFALACCDQSYPDDLVLGTSREILPVGTEADASDVQISVLWKTSILKMRDGITSLNIENLGRTVTACRNPSTVQTEAYTADHTLMWQVVDQVDIQHTPGARVEDSEPIAALLLQVLWQLLDI